MKIYRTYENIELIKPFNFIYKISICILFIYDIYIYKYIELIKTFNPVYKILICILKINLII